MSASSLVFCRTKAASTAASCRFPLQQAAHAIAGSQETCSNSLPRLQLAPKCSAATIKVPMLQAAPNSSAAKQVFAGCPRV